eukprot:g40153.t1
MQVEKVVNKAYGTLAFIGQGIEFKNWQRRGAHGLSLVFKVSAVNEKLNKHKGRKEWKYELIKVGEERVKKMIGNCVRVATPARAVFSRLLLLFNLTDYTDEEEAASAGQNQLSTVLLVNMGHVTFPNYTVLRKKKIFRHRDDLLRYDEAVHSLAEVITAMTNGFWSDALQIYKTAREKWSQLENNSDVSDQAIAAPPAKLFQYSYNTGIYLTLWKIAQ